MDLTIPKRPVFLVNSRFGYFAASHQANDEETFRRGFLENMVIPGMGFRVLKRTIVRGDRLFYREVL